MTFHSLEVGLNQKISNAYGILKNCRGEPNKELDQYYITEKTSLKKALLVDPEDYNGKRVILLGDMDLTALSIGIMSKPKDLAVLDIDKRVPEIVFKMKFDHKIRTIRYINHDIRIRMINVLKNQFDYIFIEPPMTKEGLELGLSRAVQCAKKDVGAIIFFSFDIEKEKKEMIQKMIDKMNLELIDVLLNFNEYEIDTPLSKKSSDLYILRAKSKTKETISDHYFGPLYYRESNVHPYPYLCKCGEIYNIGEGGDYKRIEDLQDEGCPKCGYNDKFLYNSSIKIE